MDYVNIIQEATLEIVNPLPAGSPLEVTFEVTNDGFLNVRAKDLANNKEIFVRIDRKSSLSANDISKGIKKITDLAVE